MDKQELLQECIDQGNECGYISWDSILDICDEKQKKVRYCVDELERMRDNNEITFELDF
jgi:hypothetical protein